MAYRDNRLIEACLFALAICAGAPRAAAQNPSGAAFPADPPPAAGAPTPVAPAPTAPPAAGPTPAPSAPSPAPLPAAPTPPPVAQPPVAQPPPPAAQAQQPYATDPRAQPGYGAAYGEPLPPPAPPEKEKSPIPPFSVRVDPLNWILEGQLGFELEVGVAKWLSIETVPVFVVDESPPWLNLGGGDARVYQQSNGWGPLSGASLGVNFWPSKLFKGYVIRTGLNNYALSYETKAADGKRVDILSHTKRQFYAMIGSLERWGAFTIGGGIGLGYDLNKESRCITTSASATAFTAGPGSCEELQIAVPVGNQRAAVAVTPFTYPWELFARLSLGVVID